MSNFDITELHSLRMKELFRLIYKNPTIFDGTPVTLAKLVKCYASLDTDSMQNFVRVVNN